MISEQQKQRQPDKIITSQESHTNIKQNVQKVQQKVFNVFQNVQLKCHKGQPAHLYCFQNSCDKNPVLCKIDDCQCHQIHSDCCESISMKNFHSKLNKNVIQVQSNFIKRFQQQIDLIIDQISNLLLNLKIKLKDFGLTKSQILLINHIKEHFNNQSKNKQKSEQEKIQLKQTINGKYLCNFKTDFNKQKIKWFQTSIQEYKNFVKTTYKQIQPYFNMISYDLENMHATLNHKRQLQSFFYSSKFVDYNDKNKQNFNQTSLSKLCKIISSSIKSEHIYSIRRLFFYDKENKQKFDTQKLLNSCKGQDNLLFLIKNSYNKKMGFFLNSKFQQQNKIFKSDQNTNTFVFSVNQSKVNQLNNSSFVYRTIRTKQHLRIEIGDNYINSQLKKKNGLLFAVPLSQSSSVTTVQLLFEGQQFYKQVSRSGYYQSSNTNELTYEKVNGLNRNTSVLGLQVTLLEVYKIQFTSQYYKSIQSLNDNLNKINLTSQSIKLQDKQQTGLFSGKMKWNPFKSNEISKPVSLFNNTSK